MTMSAINWIYLIAASGVFHFLLIRYLYIRWVQKNRYIVCEFPKKKDIVLDITHNPVENQPFRINQRTESDSPEESKIKILQRFSSISAAKKYLVKIPKELSKDWTIIDLLKITNKREYLPQKLTEFKID